MAASLKSTRPKNGETGGSCMKYAGEHCFGKLFGQDIAKDIYNKDKTHTGAALPYSKSKTMFTPPCCIVWGNGDAGHVGVIESKSGSTYTFSDSNRNWDNKVKVESGLTEQQIKDKVSSFLGYVQFP